LRTLSLLLPLLPLATQLLPAQTSAFEVATVKPSQGGNRSRYPGMRNRVFTAENIPLRRLLTVAWGVHEVSVAGPGWLDSEKFDIAAKAPEGVADSQFPPLLQSLLKERLGVVAHIENKQAPVFEMILAKDGLKLHPFDPAHPPITPSNTGGSLLIGVGTLSQIANMLTFAVQNPVIDKTGIEGRYSYSVSYSPLSAQPDPTSAASGPPDIFTAVQDQLSLRLKSARAPVNFLIVDHAEHQPTAN
jgi:uncharacterized protein (TIGR03435 family)